MLHKAERKRSGGFTLIELLVVISIIALLAAILFPVFARARENARRSSCQSNLKQIGLAFEQYKQDFDGRFPHGWDVEPLSAAGTSSFRSAVRVDVTDDPVVWPAKVLPYLKNRQVFRCPSFDFSYGNSCITPVGNPRANFYWGDNHPVVGGKPSAGSYTRYGASFVHYGYNVIFLGGGVWGDTSSSCPQVSPTTGVGVLSSAIEAPASMVLLIDNNVTNRGIATPPGFALPTVNGFDAGGNHQCNADNSAKEDYDPFDGRHFHGMNILFVDGHVKWLKKEEAAYRPAGFTTTCYVSTNWNSPDPRYIWNRK